jgi:protoporphyrinogen oxidase
LQFEIYFSLNRPLNMSKEALIEHVIDVIQKMGIAAKSDITAIDCRIVPFGNVVFDHGMLQRRQEVRDFLKGKHVHCIGRFGEWDYLWSDQSLLSGKNAVEAVLQKEISLF